MTTIRTATVDDLAAVALVHDDGVVHTVTSFDPALSQRVGPTGR